MWQCLSFLTSHSLHSDGRASASLLKGCAPPWFMGCSLPTFPFWCQIFFLDKHYCEHRMKMVFSFLDTQRSITFLRNVSLQEEKRGAGKLLEIAYAATAHSWCKVRNDQIHFSTLMRGDQNSHRHLRAPYHLHPPCWPRATVIRREWALVSNKIGLVGYHLLIYLQPLVPPWKDEL